jgi:hypothetical protein
MPVSKTGDFSSNLNAPANFPLTPEEKRDFFEPHFPHKFLFMEGKPNRCGSSSENCRAFSAYGFESCAFRYINLGLRIEINPKSAIPNPKSIWGRGAIGI